MEQLCEEDQEEPESQKSGEEMEPGNDEGGEDSELIFVGVERVNEDAELIFVGVTSHSKPIVSTILNRATPGSYSRRRKYGQLRRDPARRVLHPPVRRTPPSEAVAVSPVSPAESRSTDSPIIIEPSYDPVCQGNSPQPKLNSSAELCAPSIRFTSSLQHPGGLALSVGGVNEGSSGSKRHSALEVNGVRSKRAKLGHGVPGEHSSALSPSGHSLTKSTEHSAPSKRADTSVSRVQNGVPFPKASPKDSANCKPVNPNKEHEGPVDTASSRPASQHKTTDSQEGTPVVLLHDFYYGHHDGHGQPEQKTHTTFKCFSCMKVLKNVRFMNHMKHHLELERQRGDSWDSHTICQHCHRQFPTPFQLQRHIERVHIPQEPSAVCKICELAFDTDQSLLQHMKDTHKPGEMPYVCQVCNYRSSAFIDMDTHFRTCHENTKSLLCPFCLKVFKTASPYMCHYRGHREKSTHQCSKCRLQFLTFKEKMEHKTQYHQMFKKPEQLEGLPSESRVVIQVSPGPGQPGVSITVSTLDSEPSLPGQKAPQNATKSSLGKAKPKAPQSKSKAPVKTKNASHVFVNSAQ
ncbi:zinc finger protein 280B [Orycteropus afer afer]|uniref:Zinc finger protein 280B n=1 Tax=Orycteropus afer afer TaxID=1230840 RepID=A0A8B7BBP0_ORYAF|nr:zinc finger protein 280B [Orycteropus afer afer]